MAKITRKEAAKIYELFLKNAVRGYTIEDIFDMVYAEKFTEKDLDGNPLPIDSVERKREFDEFRKLIEDAKSHGQTGHEIANYLNAERDTVDIIKYDDNGNIEVAHRFEGDPVFDPSHKTDLTPLTGSPDFQFGDESVGSKPSIPVIGDTSGVSPRNIPVFDDSETNDLKIVKPGEKEDIDFPNSNPNISDDDDFGQGGPGGIGL